MDVMPQLFVALEQITTFANPNWRTLSCDPMTGAIGGRRSHIEKTRREK
ncbi:MAG: hypothetical protein QOG72_285 [Sphingomonadales bacterium]|jgi:hypothetical protein|nr:hypothetical protein [Sphingomonadales bacterium]